MEKNLKKLDAADRGGVPSKILPFFRDMGKKAAEAIRPNLGMMCTPSRDTGYYRNFSGRSKTFKQNRRRELARSRRRR